MHEFPPKSADQVTLANWRTSPFNRWAFHHVREVVPSADIPNDPHDVWRLAEEPVDTGGLLIENDQGALGLDDFLTNTATDGLVVLHHGRIVIERYPDDMPSETPHILMSVSKSLLGLLAGIQIERGELTEEALATDYLPELSETAYAGATVRHRTPGSRAISPSISRACRSVTAASGTCLTSPVPYSSASASMASI